MTVRELWAALLGSQLLCFSENSCEEYDLPKEKYSSHDFFKTFRKSHIWNKHVIILHTGTINEPSSTTILLTIDLEHREE